MDNPNDRPFADINIATLSSTSDVNQFLNTYNHNTLYKNGNKRLSIGNKITINDGTYNTTWYIAGFDLEHNQVAADGTIYDNGYGIMLIPETCIKDDYSISSPSLGFINSKENTIYLPTIANNLKNILGSHLVLRNVLLSSGISGNNANSYQWTTAYATLPSVGQLTGTFASHNNKYDDGEANYKLPLFDHMNYWNNNFNFRTRCIINSDYYWVVTRNGTIQSYYVPGEYDYRPLIYIR